MMRIGPGREFVFVASVIVVAAVTRLYRLGSPDVLVFDEVYYVQDACSYLGWDQATCGVHSEASSVHPPVGKWLIALGISLFGYEPFGWRITAVVAGVITVAALYLLARRLTQSVLVATVAAGMLALDPLSIVSSRVGMLDVFVTCMVVAMVLFAVIDRDALIRSGVGAHALWRPWRAATGLTAGLAIATKWSGVFALVAVLALVVLWEASSPHRAERGGRGVVRAMPSVLVWLIVTPAVIYLGSYAGRLDGHMLALPWAEGSWLRAFADRLWFMVGFHSRLEDTHPYASPAWSWLLGKRAVVYFFEVDPAGRYREILAFANPLLWLPGLAAVIATAATVLRTRAVWQPEVVIAMGVGMTYVPWLVLAPGRTFVFLHYVLPTVPFLALALGWSLTKLRPRARRPMTAVVATVAIAVVLFWHPLIYAEPLNYDSWRLRIPFTDCTPAEQTDGRLAPRPGGGAPPSGWCWV